MTTQGSPAVNSSSNIDVPVVLNRNCRSWQGWTKVGRDKMWQKLVEERRRVHEARARCDDDEDDDESRDCRASGTFDSESSHEEDYRDNDYDYEYDSSIREMVSVNSGLSTIEEEPVSGDEKEVDDPTIYSQSFSFNEYVARHEQNRQPKSFFNRFLEVLGMAGSMYEDDGEDEQSRHYEEELSISSRSSYDSRTFGSMSCLPTRMKMDGDNINSYPSSPICFGVKMDGHEDKTVRTNNVRSKRNRGPSPHTPGISQKTKI